MKFIASFFFFAFLSAFAFSFASISACICSNDLASFLLFLVVFNLPVVSFSTSLCALRSFIAIASSLNLASLGS